MRKLSIYALTAVTALGVSGAVPAAAYAATNTYTIPGGNNRVVVISGTGMDSLKDTLGQIGNLSSGNCNIELPGFNRPGAGVPDNSLPWEEFPVPENPGQETPGQPDNGGSMDSYASQVAKLVNEERAKAGLSPLTVHNGAVNAAQTRAKEIEQSFSHTRPNGSSFSTALTAAGVNYRSSGENIAYGQRSPEQVMQTWMNSSGHRANILNSNFTSIGVGHYKNAAGVDYWTQLFIQ